MIFHSNSQVDFLMETINFGENSELLVRSENNL
jgi:hypothetical protein